MGKSTFTLSRILFGLTSEEELAKAMESVISKGIRDGAFPGAVAVASSRGREAWAVEGLAQAIPESEKREMTRETRFDVASLTKVVVTTTLLMKSVEKGLLDLNDPVDDYLSFDKRVRVINLANHSSGLPGWLPLYSTGAKTPAEAVKLISQIEISEPGKEELYSDLGFIVLGHILEKIYGMQLDQLAKKYIFDPIGMESTCFSPCPGAAATEVVDGRPLVGVVHDENSRALGGKCGHAGLFSTAQDLMKFSRSLLDGTLLSSASIQAMLSKDNVARGGNHAVGWQVIVENRPSSAGCLLSPLAFGHTGFTGTSIWIDPEKQLVVILLTNSVHYGRGRNINKYRRLLADAVCALS